MADKVVLEIDQALNDLDVIDEWLVHYTLMLDGMGADVQQVETRNKNLQVASANQKYLLTYMEEMLVIDSINSFQITYSIAIYLIHHV